MEVAQTTNTTISKLGESSREIGNVIKVITSVAEQTNLLALNATIEAARAGEAGKGFAIVANEVKELAKQTTATTNEISRSVSEAATASEAIRRNISEVARTAANASQHIEETRAANTSFVERTSALATVVNHFRF